MRMLLIYIRNAKYRLNGFFVKLFLLSLGCKVGKNFKCLSIPRFRVLPKKNIQIGDNVTIGYDSIFEITEEGKLILDNQVVIGDRAYISTSSLIHMKFLSGIAENVSIRGTMHQLQKHNPVRLNKNKTKPIILEEDSSIGASSVILMGTHIPKGVFIGANSVVTDRIKLEPYTIYAGSPVKKIKERE
ncbi:MAG TPA: hypothetical protein DIU39_05570 [Flavobacteriales bacterium]|nr:hypothetical protein [Flavobacteriales bacterium]